MGEGVLQKLYLGSRYKSNGNGPLTRRILLAVIWRKDARSEG